MCYVYMKKVTLFGPQEWPKQYDSETLINFYINDIDEARHYLWANLWYFIKLTRFQGITQEEFNENAWEIMLFLDGLFQKQIAKRNNIIDAKARGEILAFVRLRLWWWFMNAKKPKRDALDWRSFVLDDEDLVNCASVDDEYKENLDDILAELLFSSWMTDDEIKICILYTQRYSKNEIKKLWKFKQELINDTVDKLKEITKIFISKRQ